MALNTAPPIFPRRDVARTDEPIGLIGASAVMRHVHESINRLARTDITTLIYGETGTGKELVAASIHALSARSSGPLVCVNCAGLSDSLIESELFGHMRGAFTGAVHDRVGRFEAASGGTLFLDEIGDMSLWAQARLLRVIETKSIERVGSHKAIKLDIRIIAATNRNLHEDMQAGRFRADLFYRLHVGTLHLPSLRERREDIPLLAQYFLDRYHRSHSRTIPRIATEALDAMMRYAWPGNVRELSNAVEYASVHASGSTISLDDLPPSVSSAFSSAFDCDRRQGERGRFIPVPVVPDPLLNTPPKGFDTQTLRRILDQQRWHIGNAAGALGVHRTTLWRHTQRLGLHAPRLAHPKP